MSIEVKCPQCGKSFTVPDEQAGQPGRCACGAAVVVPTPQASSQSTRSEAEAAAPAGTVACPACGAANPPGYQTCGMCDAPAPGRGPSAGSRPRAAAPRRRRGALIAIPVVLLLLLGGAGAYWYLMMWSPRQVAQQFLEAGMKVGMSGDLAPLKRLVTAASVAEIEKQEAQLAQLKQQVEAMKKDPRMAEFLKQAEAMQSQAKVEVLDMAVQGSTATVRYKTSMAGGQGMMGGFSMEQTLCLAREGLSWKADLIKTEEAAMEQLRQRFGGQGGQKLPGPMR
jgi:hypothetical protein